jgi:large subunit ribosomal protein L15
MKLQDLKPAKGAKHSKKRVGRGPGSGIGRTSTRGMNGQNARAGGGVRPGFEGGQTPLNRRLPKRGFKNYNRIEYSVVNLRDLEMNFDANATVDIEALLELGLVNRLKNGVKILGEGEITKPLTIKAHKFSKSATTKIEQVGGKVEVI